MVRIVLQSNPLQTCRSSYRIVLGLMVLTAIVSCASFTNPVADGIPVRRLPDELRGKSRQDLKLIPLDLLHQTKPINHVVGAGDILGILIDGVLGDPNNLKGLTRPMSRPNASDLATTGGFSDTPTPGGVGYPALVQDDGTIYLPTIKALHVEGKTLLEIKQMLVKAYTVDHQIIKPGKENIQVSLISPRRFSVLVIREDGNNSSSGGQSPTGLLFGPNQGAILGSSNKGSGYSLELPIYENDVMTALTRTGGLPGNTAKNEVTIYRKKIIKDGEPPVERIIHIPLRLRPSDPIPFKPEDVVLGNGDIVYIATRELEVFYTGGLLGASQIVLPRDYDLDILQAVIALRGPVINGGFGQAFAVASLTNSGLGNPSPSLITVLRKTANGQQIPIRVDLSLALVDPRERILIQPGDTIILQERLNESFSRYFSSFFKFSFLGTILNQKDASSTGAVALP